MNTYKTINRKTVTPQRTSFSGRNYSHSFIKKKNNNTIENISNQIKDGHKNLHLSNLITNSRINAKLSVGKPNDLFEQEADQIADKVVGSSQTNSHGEIKRKEEEKKEPIRPKLQLKKEEKKEEPIRTKLQLKEEEKKEEPIRTKLQLKKEEKKEELIHPKLQLKEEEKKEEPIHTKLQLKEEEKKEEPIRTKLQLKEEEKKEEPIHTKFQLKEKEKKEELIQTKSFEGTHNQDISTQLSNRSSGSPLSSGTKTFMESSFGVDFSGVRIHTDSNAVQMNKSLNAQAFTHGNDVYFNEGKYNPDSSDGKKLIAHELTHTIQQGASVQKKSSSAVAQTKSVHASSNNTAVIRRSWLGDAWNAVSDVASAAVDVVSEGLEAGLNWIKEQFADFVQEIPGYKLLCVALGEDPIKGNAVERNGRNFIEAGLDIIPFGNLFKRKLEETGKLEEAAAWLDAEIAKIDISLSSITADISAFWNSLSLSDIGSPTRVLERAANIIRRPVGQIITFAENVAKKFLQIVKDFLISQLVAFIRNNTRGYPLLTVILGKDPITEEVVERNGMNLIRGFMLLSADGEEQLRQMQESGSLQRAADWIDTAVAELDLSWAVIRNLFSEAWRLITIENLMSPIETFERLVGLFAAPVGRIIRFVVKVGLKILEFIKKALLSRLSQFARETRGYPLITVLLGKDPFTEERVPRNAENIIHGFMSLMEGGEEQFQQMKESGAIRRTTEWIEGAVARLGFTWEYIKGLFIQAWNSFSIRDLAAPLEAFARIVRLFAPPILRLIEFVWEVIKKVIEILLIIMRFPTDLVRNIITKAMQAINDIKRDPIGFLKNILRAIKLGFTNFFSNILNHLLFGVSSWLFSELNDVGVTPPRDFTLRSILGFVLEILGITMDRIWRKLAEKIGQERVDRIRNMIDRLEGIWLFIKDVTTRGPAAIWEYVVEKLSNLWDTVLETVRNWVITKIIEKVVTKLLSMLDPTGIMAVVNSVIAIYRAIESFIRYLRQMLEIVNSFVEGVAEIAKGNITKAAEFVENAMHRSMPVIIGFLANQVGLSGIGRKIGEMIEKVREKVDAAIGWLIDKAIRAGTAFLNMLRRGAAAVGRRVASWLGLRKTFNASDGTSHTISIQGTTRPQIIIQTEPHDIRWFADKLKNPGHISDEVKRNQIMEITDRAIKGNRLIAIADMFDAQVASNANTSPQQDINRLINEAERIIPAALLSDQKPELPMTQVNWQQQDSKAHVVIANPLSKRPGNTTGNSSTNVTIAGDDLTHRLPGRMVTSSVRTAWMQTDYEKTHLLHHQLHGPSAPWNLAYAKRTINEKMKGNEDYVINRPNDVFYYKTQVDYWNYQGDKEWKNSFAKSYTITLKYIKKDDSGDWVDDTSRIAPTFGPWPSNEPPDSNVASPLPRIPTSVEDAYRVANEMNRNGIGWAEIERQFQANIPKLKPTPWNRGTIKTAVELRRDRGEFS